MRVSFSRSVQYTPTWRGNRELPDGEQVKAVLKPMKVEDLMTLMDGLNMAPGESEKRVSMGDMRTMVKDLGHIIPKYAEITGLEDADGPVTADALIQFPYYMDLAGELLMQLASISMPSVEASGNLNAQSGS